MFVAGGVETQSASTVLLVLGHKDIRSTLVYLTTTEELLHLANERFKQYSDAMHPGDRRPSERNRCPAEVCYRSSSHNWMGHQRNLSPKTVTSYRDAWRLFLRFVSGHVGRPVAALKLEDLAEAEVLAFLQHIESTRSVSIGTRNCRLAAIRSFFRFVAEREPATSSQCAAILRIPTKKTSSRGVCYCTHKRCPPPSRLGLARSWSLPARMREMKHGPYVEDYVNQELDKKAAP